MRFISRLRAVSPLRWLLRRPLKATGRVRGPSSLGAGAAVAAGHRTLPRCALPAPPAAGRLSPLAALVRARSRTRPHWPRRGSLLRGRLLDAPILALPKMHGHYIVDVDASYEQLGCCLQQRQSDGEYHPIGYCTRALLPAEKNYFATEVEALVVVWAVTYLRSYLQGADLKNGVTTAPFYRCSLT